MRVESDGLGRMTELDGSTHDSAFGPARPHGWLVWSRRGAGTGWAAYDELAQSTRQRLAPSCRPNHHFHHPLITMVTLHFCHECAFQGTALMQPGPVCPRCGGEFLEEVPDSGSASNHPQSFHVGAGDIDDIDEDDDEDEDGPAYGGFGRAPRQPMDLGSLLAGVLGNLAGAAGAGQTPRQQQQRQQSGSSSGGQGPSTSTRSGSASFGPAGFQWHFSSTAGGAAGPSTSPQGTRSSTRPDDGMGGAGGGSDGRYFDHGSNSNSAQGSTPSSSNTMPGQYASPFTAFAGHGPNPEEGPDLPPHAAALPDLFANLFGPQTTFGPDRDEDGHFSTGHGGMPVNPITALLGSLFGGPAASGRMGDYVFGQQALDDVISQVMEQTQGSQAPPPASEEAIKKLKRVKAGDVDAASEYGEKRRKSVGAELTIDLFFVPAELARNRECPTCLDAILPATAANSPSTSRRPSTVDDVLGADKNTTMEDDPPDVAPGDDDDAPSDSLVILPCKHTGHEECIVPWLQRNGTCPICREPLEPRETGDAAPAAAPPTTTTTTQPMHSGQQQQMDTPHNPAETAELMGELEDTDEEFDDAVEAQSEAESREERRKRIREAAERRMGGGSSTAAGGRGVGSAQQPEDPFDLD